MKENVIKEKSKSKEIPSFVLNEMIKYIEGTEVGYDAEWGKCRTLKELIKSNMMPELYNTLLLIKKDNK
jgi:hypothetical protein